MSNNKKRNADHLLVLGSNTGLCEIMLQVLDAPEGHDRLAFCRTATERPMFRRANQILARILREED
jgi:hypothetical protein